MTEKTQRLPTGFDAPQSAESKHLPTLIGFIAISLLVAGVGTWLLSARLAGTVGANGRVEVDKNRQIIQHPDGGVVQRLLVKSGDHVEKGQVVLQLESDDKKSELAIIEASYLELLARRARLTAELENTKTINFPSRLTDTAQLRPEIARLMAGQTALFEARTLSFIQQRAHLSMQAREIEAQGAGVDAQIAALQRQTNLIEQELTAQRKLRDRGLAQTSRVLALERESASLDGRMGALNSQRALVKVQRGEVVLAATRLVLQRRESVEAELEETRAKALELAEREQRLRQLIERRDLRAPTSGIIHEVMVSGDHAVLRPAEPVLSIIEQDRPLVIMARLAPINVDDVRPGQIATLRFPGLTSRSTTELTGELTRISPDIVSDATTGETYYQIEIAFDMGQMAAPHRQHLLPGMPAEVFLRTANISPLHYLLSPFLSFFSGEHGPV
ncbi:HlyD family type I secretion periplasmic adaptor subunit [Thioclava pacifica]|uniref:Membrane fusion protein (MFP) family protein n=1 Tax=Thioclava pacifica DSM 10166 TaxID=1353537 RepID=A0A074JFB4_9RHOB|nr:HlyD family type I secretion periplasmic adaptor subunit [Thioclava pacifica]KEO54570.1 hypothetical protein TP2_06460 [Thioclava pacifica DSM 10166]